MFQDDCWDGGEDAADQELDAGHFYSIYFRRKVVNDQNMQGKQECTDQDQNVSFADGEAVGDAKQVETDQRHHNGNPDKGAASFFHKKPKDWDNDDVAGGEKSGFSNGGVLDAQLLEVGGKAEADAAGDAAEN